MSDLRIGNASLSVEGIRPLKKDVQIDDKLKSQLSKDGFDSIIFKKGDEMFIAYQKNMKLDNLKLNPDINTFDVNSAYDMGQMSVDGDAVQVLHVDDENKDSFWVAPYKSMASGVKSMINNPFGKAAILGFVGGATTTLVGKNMAATATSERVFNGVLLGTAGGGVIGGLKAGAESDIPEFWDTGAGVGAAALGYGAGALVAAGGDELVKVAAQNPKVTAITLGVAAVVVGTGVALDALSDNGKPATYRVINQISAK
ncbi:MAG: hypothetical protein IV090_06595 [Candidatus Sericytochromatia bacterium]|nr:hypothetical protein [Candidatus Sericytochromatia bacterium]